MLLVCVPGSLGYPARRANVAATVDLRASLGRSLHEAAMARCDRDVA
jgi:hypothetical protein